MNNLIFKKVICLILCVFITCLSLPVYALFDLEVEQETIETIIREYPLADGLRYFESVLKDKNNQLQRTYRFEYTPGFDSQIVFATGDNIYSRNYISSLVNGVEETHGSVVAGMNADFFNMSTGVPLSLVIKDGVLLTSDGGYNCLAKDADGRLFIDTPSVKITITKDEQIFNVWSLNKELVDWGLCLFTDDFDSITHINTPSTLAVMYPYVNSYTEEEFSEVYEFSFEETNLVKIGDMYYELTNDKTIIGQTQNLVVAEILQDGTGQENVKIPENGYILAGDNNTFASSVNRFSVGDIATIEISANEKFYGVNEAIGTSHLIVKDGEVIEEDSLYHYKTANPRTAVGITGDGKLILFAVDGRQSQLSSGMKIKELAEEMVRLGCVVAANLDGGGSTTVKALLPEKINFSLVNSPSEKSERKISNAILFTNKQSSINQPVLSYLGQTQIVLSNSYLPLLSPSYTDANYYPVAPEQVPQDTFTYSAYDGYVQDGIYYPDGFVGETYIISNNGSFTNKAKKVISTDTVDEIYLEQDSFEIYAGQTVNLNATAKKNFLDVVCTNESFVWNVDQNFGMVLEDGRFLSANEGENIEISASVGDVSKSVFVNVLPVPFVDIDGHWAFDEICSLHKEKIVQGEKTISGFMFSPERTYSRYEFCVMLARILGLTTIQESDNEQIENSEIAQEEQETQDDLLIPFEDSDNIQNSTLQEFSEIDTQKTQTQYTFSDEQDIPDWAYDSVLKLYEKGYLERFCEISQDQKPILDGAKPVTRKQVISVIGRICKDAPEDYILSANDITFDDPEYKYIKDACAAGIFQGYEDGSLRLLSNLKRSEGAAVFVRLLEYIKNQLN